MRTPSRFCLTPLVAVLTAAWSTMLVANPQGPVVAHGAASFTQSGSTLTVTNTPGAIINWQQFNINRGELTRFVQQNAASQVLNRVVGVDPSVILGSLQSNGRVFLVNPNGIVFGVGAQVDVAGLVASTLRLSDADFLNQRLRFTETPGAGAVANAGTIRSASGGEVLLVAPRVENSGLIHAPGGVILLAAGRSVEVADIDRPQIRVEITNTEEQAVNLGTLLARNISIYGGLVRNSGRIQASSAVMGENGKVTLKAAQRVVLEPTSVIEATGSQGTTGGEVNISAHNTAGLAGGGEVQVQGVISVQPVAATQAPLYGSNRPLAPMNTARTAINSVANSVPGAAGDGAPAGALAPALSAPTGLADPVGAGLDVSEPGSLAPLWLALGAPMPASVNAPVNLYPTAPAPVSTPAPPAPLPHPARPQPALPALPPLSGGVPAGAGTGGSVRISAGGRVVVGDGARIDASGSSGGGEILVGGGWQGLNPNIVNSQYTYIASSATLVSNATLRGNGGLVVVWSEQGSQVRGRISARGGALGGNGGSIETSSKGWLDVAHAADASAPQGQGGLWLLDPNNVTITTGSDTAVTGNPNFTTTGDSAIVTVATIQAALNAGTNVTITTSTGGANTQEGNISLTSHITTSSATDVTLTLVAHNNISVSGNLSATGTGKLNLVLNADSDVTGGGTASVGSTLKLNGGTLGTSNGSAVQFTGGTLDHVALDTNVTLSGSTTLKNGLTIGAGRTLTLKSTLRYDGTQTVAGSGTLLFDTSGSIYRYSSSGTALTVGPNITVNGTGSGTVYFGYYTDETIHFQGTLNANVSGKTWRLGNWNNTGLVNVSAGTVDMNTGSGTGAWTNTATAGKGIALSGGVLNLGDSFSATSLGNLQRSGGTVNLTGVFANGGGTLDIGSAGIFKTGGLDTFSGTITGGTLSNTDATPNFKSNGGTLDGVTLGTSLNFTSGYSTYIKNSLKLTAGTTVALGSHSLYWQTIDANQQLNTVSGSATITASGGTWLYAGSGGAGQTVTIGSGITFQGYSSISDGSAAAVVNNGTLNFTGSAYIGPATFTNNGTVSTSTNTLVLNGTTFNNNGSVTVTGGTLSAGVTNWNNNAGGLVNINGGSFTFSGSTAINNGGAIALASGGTLTLGGDYTLAQLTSYLGGSSFSRASGSTLNFSGKLSNDGTLDIGSAGIFRTGGLGTFSGTITGGTLVNTDATPSFTSHSGTLDGVTLGTSFNFTSGYSTYIKNSLKLTAGTTVALGSHSLYWQTFDANQQLNTVSGNATVTASGGTWLYTGYGGAGQTVTIGSGITFQGHSYISDSWAATVVNNGTLNYTGSASITPAIFTNNGTISTSTGTVFMNSTTSFNNNGSLTVTGGAVSATVPTWNNNTGGAVNINGGSFTFGGSTAINNGGTIALASAGTLTLGGNYTLAQLTSYLGGSNFSRASGSTLNFSGKLSNEGTLDIGSAGIFRTGGLGIFSGTITGGTLVNTDATPNFNSHYGTLDGVTLGGSLNFGASGYGTYIKNSLVLTGGSTVALGNNDLYWSTLNTAQELKTSSGNATITGTGGTFIYAGNGGTGQAVTIASGITFQGSGSISNGSTATVVNNGTLNLSGSSSNIYPHTFTNNGTVTTSASNFSIGGTNFNNNGTLNVTAGAVAASATHWNNNAGGVLNITGGSFNFSGSAAINNGGTIALASAGTLTLGGTYTLAQLTSYFGGSNFSRASGSTVNFSGTLNNEGTLNIGSDGVFRTGGLGTFSGTIVGGTVTNTDATPLFKSQYGTLDGVTMGSSMGFNADGYYSYIKNSLLLTGGTTVALGNHTLYWQTDNATQELKTVSGNATITSSGGGLIQASYVSNQIVTIGSGITYQGSGSLSNYYYYAGSKVVNNGTLNFTSGSSSIGSNTFTNNGTMRVLSGGTLSLGSSSTFSSAGAGMDVQSGGVLTLNGSYSFTGGLPVVTGAVVNLQSGATATHIDMLKFQGGTAVLSSSLTNAGTLTLAGSSGKLRLASYGAIVGGTVATSGGVEMSSTYGSLDGVTLATSMTVENGGMLFINNGLTLSGGSRVILNGTGSSSRIYINGTGAQTIGGTGSIEFAGTGGNYVSPYLGAPSLVLGSGITVNANAGGEFWRNANGWTLNGNFNVTAPSGTVSTSLNTFTAGAGAAFNVTSGTLAVAVPGGTPTSAGFSVASGATLQVAASTELTLGAGFNISGSGNLVNAGSTINIDGLANNTLHFGGSGATNFNSAITVGAVDTAGLVGINANVVSTNASNFNGGTLTIASGKTLTLQGGMNWSDSSTIAGPGTLVLPAGQTLAMTGNGSYFLSNVTFNNAGTITMNLSSGSGAYLYNGAVLNNTGVLSFTSSGSNTIAAAYGGGTFNNTGTVQSTGAGGGILGGSGLVVTHSASGLIHAQAGTLTVYSLAGATNTGELRMASGATIFYNGNLTNSGTISGSGTLRVGSGGTLTNLGTIAPGIATGDTTGTLAITGNLVLGSSGTVQMQLTSTTAGNFDALAVSGNVNYGGALALSTSASSGSFALVSSATRTGLSEFASITGFSGATPTYGATGLSLGFTVPVQWTGAADGVWSNVANWNGGLLPGASDDVVISSGAVNLIDVSSANYSVRSLTLGSGQTLRLSGGSLTLGEASTFNGNLTIAGGTLTLNGATTVSGIYTHSAGTVNGSGALTLAGAASFTGTPTLGGTGVLTTQGITNVLGSVLLERTWSNAAGGVVNLLDTGQVRFNASALVINMGTWNLAGTHATPLAVQVAGANTFNNSGTLVKTGAASATVDIAAFVNTGTVNVSAGTLALTGTTVTQRGTMAVASGATLSRPNTFTNDSGAVLSGLGTVDVGASGTFTNHGTLRPGQSGTLRGVLKVNGNLVLGSGSTVELELNNDATAGAFDALQVSGSAALGGTLVADGVASSGNYALVTAASRTGTFAVVSGALAGLATNYNSTTLYLSALVSGDWSGLGDGVSLNDAANWVGGVLPTASSNVTVGSGANLVLSSGSMSLNNLTLSGRGLTLSGGASLQLNGTGSLSGTLVLNDATLAGTGTLTAPNYSLTSATVQANLGTGTLQQVGGNSSLTGTSAAALVQVQAGTLSLASAGRLASTAAVSVGAGATLGLNGAQTLGAISGSGLVALGAHTLTVGQGGAASAYSGTFSGTGSLVKTGSGALSFSGAQTVQQLTVLSGTVGFNGVTTIGNAGLKWNGGSIQGASAGLVLNGAFEVGAGSVVWDGPSLVLNATTSPNGWVLPSGSSVEVRSGVLDASGVTTKVSGGAYLWSNTGSLLLGTLTNQGTLRASGGVLSVSAGTHSGAFQADAGATMRFVGTGNSSDGATLLGAGSFASTGSLTVADGGLTIAEGSTVNVASLPLVGTGTIRNSGVVTAAGWTWGGAGFSNLSAGALNMTGGGFTGVFTNAGTFNVAGTVTLGGSASTQEGGKIVLPLGANLLTTGGALRWVGGSMGGDASGAGSLTFGAAGSLQFAGAGARIIDGLALTLQDLSLPGGSLTLRSGSLTLTGTTNIPASAALQLSGGTLINNSAMNIAGSFSLTGGAFEGSGSMNVNGGTLTLPSSSTVTWNSTGALSNSGTLNFLRAGSTVTNSISNSGTITAGAVTFTQTFTNTGTLALTAGQTTVFSGGVTQTSGELQLAGGTLQGALVLNGGKLVGTGTIDGSLTVNNASFAPGNSPGAMTVKGNLNLSSTSVLTVELGGTAQGAGYDYVNVLGTANLGGTLNVAPYGGFVAQPGDTFTFMNFSAVTGGFASVNIPAPGNLTYVATSTALSVRSAAVVDTMPPLPTVKLVEKILAASQPATLPVALAMAQVQETKQALTAELPAAKPSVPVEKAKEKEEEVCP